MSSERFQGRQAFMHHISCAMACMLTIKMKLEILLVFCTTRSPQAKRSWQEKEGMAVAGAAMTRNCSQTQAPNINHASTNKHKS